jgi:hypothetical protein
LGSNRPKVDALQQTCRQSSDNSPAENNNATLFFVDMSYKTNEQPFCEFVCSTSARKSNPNGGQLRHIRRFFAVLRKQSNEQNYRCEKNKIIPRKNHAAAGAMQQ